MGTRQGRGSPCGPPRLAVSGCARTDGKAEVRARGRGSAGWPLGGAGSKEDADAA